MRMTQRMWDIWASRVKQVKEVIAEVPNPKAEAPKERMPLVRADDPPLPVVMLTNEEKWRANYQAQARGLKHPYPGFGTCSAEAQWMNTGPHRAEYWEGKGKEKKSDGDLPYAYGPQYNEGVPRIMPSKSKRHWMGLPRWLGGRKM